MNTPTKDNTELESFLLNLFGIGAVKISTAEGFRMKIHETKPEVPLSPIYINLRVKENKEGPLTQEDVARMVYFFHELIKRRHLTFAGIAGVPRAGEPFAESLQSRFYHAYKQMIPVLTLGKDESDGKRAIGQVQKVQGLPRGTRVLLVDDLITQSKSKLEAVRQLRNAGFIVEDCIVFLDREQGGPLEMHKEGVRLHSVTTLTYMLDYYLRAHLISPEDDRIIRDYIAKY